MKYHTKIIEQSSKYCRGSTHVIFSLVGKYVKYMNVKLVETFSRGKMYAASYFIDF